MKPNELQVNTHPKCWTGIDRDVTDPNVVLFSVSTISSFIHCNSVFSATAITGIMLPWAT